MKPLALVLQDTPMILNITRPGTYSIGADYSEAPDESVVAVVRLGEIGESDELVAILRRDRNTGKWVQE